MPSELDLTHFSIHILDRIINCVVPTGFLLHDVFTLHKISQTPDAILHLKKTNDPLQADIKRKDGIITLNVSGEDAFNMNLFRSYIGLLVHYLTKAIFIHGCGIYSIVKNSGILILGKKKSGKTTISDKIQLSYIIDDDQMLLFENKLIGIGKKSAHTEELKKGQNVVYEKAGYRQTNLGIIFVLMKDLEGGTFKKIDSKSILTDLSLVWHHNLYTFEIPKDYCKDKQIPNVPAYFIGTNENKHKTIELLNELIKSQLVSHRE